MSGTRLIPRQPDNAAHSPPSRNLRDEGISRAKLVTAESKKLGFRSKELGWSIVGAPTA